ncbi:1-deoxy-D-xylulose-5-phosphate synthase [Streptomyces sp. RB5]|uniref:1-deoxy-D-xylulose-5-phosphate synthase n=1 Tax=Streptomyces smaragdinus TaxID=2585196 RepID=A0A7K0CJQ2_9ACTN|nr:transketolase C-terminal domain-containing protein [Streptomyces smaragdinus]MQY13252.1 1-deoxy-D-xylulose-5-phosphate synthase [Streptomyces smaragdinus]
MGEAWRDLDAYTREALGALPPLSADGVLPPGLGGTRALELFDAQAGSRHLDFAARQLTAEGAGYYSIGSSGHEGNAAVAAALRPTDPALLHYRSGGFFLERARQAGVPRPLRDVLLGVVAAAEDPISGGRHKVFGNAAAAVLPQTSTIASHLPRAMGLAFALGRGAALGRELRWPADSVVVCSFGDASANHSTAAGAIGAALHSAYQGLDMPLLLVCEDNGLGISVPTPPGWIEQAYGHRPGLRYVAADGCDLFGAYEAAVEAAEYVRSRRRPAFLHLRTVRLLGHAGSDVESAYRTAADIGADVERDPLVATGRLLAGAGVAGPGELVARYERIGREVAALAGEVRGAATLTSAVVVTAPIAPLRAGAVAADAARPVGAGARRRAFGGRLPERAGAVTLAQAVNRTLADLLARDGDVLVFGEDVGRKGGVYGVTRGLRRMFGARRVFDTLLDEQSILGAALGAGVAGFVPVPEIQFLAYLHNAADQLRGEAATLSFFSAGQYRNPLVVRIPAYAYQKGFGGHFHNDNSVAALRDIPGLVIASPARADDAAAMLRTCVSAARTDGRVCVFLEPIALYHRRDLHRAGDDGWLAEYVEPAGWAGADVPLGRARVYGDGADLTLVGFANGVPMCLRVARRLAAEGIRARVLDLRWLAPLPAADLLAAARATGRVLVADETRRTGGVSEAVCTALTDAGFPGRVARVAGADSFVPLGPATGAVLLSEERIEAAARELMAG